MEICPTDKRKLRACLLCSLVKTTLQFRADGCDNCEEILHLRHNNDKITECTSSQFDGMIAMLGSGSSWVGKWQRVEKFKPGCYAIRVQGKLGVDIVETLQEKGIRYRPRDGSVTD